MIAKKYKLIKEYPGSPELGTIVDRRDVNSPNINMTVSQNYVENYPEFWQEVVEENYEILSFVCNQNFNELRQGEIITRQENGQYKGINILTWEGEDGFVKMKHWSIHSVKRLSDGEIFTLGDKVQDSLTDELTNFKVQKIVYFYPGEKIISQAESGTTMPLNTIRHADFLFITIDKEKIYEGDNYIAIFYDFEYLEQKAIKDYKLDNASLRFSTIEHVKEFILLNKPCLSINDIVNNCLNIPNNRISNSVNFAILESLEQLVNSKINGKTKD
jgi:hypothetical protein